MQSLVVIMYIHMHFESAQVLNDGGVCLFSST